MSDELLAKIANVRREEYGRHIVDTQTVVGILQWEIWRNLERSLE